MTQLPRHQCMIYESAPSTHLTSIAAVLKQKLLDNHRCIYLNSLPMVAGIRSYLAALGVDVVREIDEGNLILSADQSHLVDGSFDPDRMLDTLETAVNQAKEEGYRGLWATGDMSWEFGPKKDFSKLLDYERGLESLFQRYPCLGGVCQYHRDSLPHEAVHHGLIAHQVIFINDTLSRLNPQYEPAE